MKLDVFANRCVDQMFILVRMCFMVWSILLIFNIFCVKQNEVPLYDFLSCIKQHTTLRNLLGLIVLNKAGYGRERDRDKRITSLG